MATFVVIILDDSSEFEYTADLCPRITTFRSHSLDFKKFYTHPVCTLSRVGFMYGSYGKKIGTINENPLFVEPVISYPSIASVLAANGYATCLIGKWHAGVDPQYPSPHTDPFAQAPISRGYQEWRAGITGNIGDGGGTYSGSPGWTRVDSDSSGFTRTLNYSIYAPAAQVFEAADWLVDHPVGTFPNRFMHIALNLPHAPYHVPPTEYLNGYTGETTTNRGKYLAMLRAADTLVGILLDALPNDAHIWLWSDNGTPDTVPPPGIDPNHLKRSSHKEGTRVLGAFQQEGIPSGISNRLMHSIDIGATILKVAGIAKPVEWDGLDFGRTAILTEREDDTDGSKDRCVRTDCYLFRELTDTSAVVTEELYYLPDDPDETRNVIHRPRHGAALSWLRARLEEAEI